ncbi:MAG: aldehyde dehydrogenase family protein, partial [Propionibacteriaceae bacterium]|nr:aldehyde dehydrogenase family protein [Propionibacteriaceae bacterium]
MAESVFIRQAHSARAAARALALVDRGVKDRALGAMADSLLAATAAILAANRADVERGRAAGMPDSLADRLALDEGRVAGMAAGLRDVAGLADPVGEVVRGWTLANGVHVDQVRVPLGVVGIVYEARPNVTADAAAICLKAGNAVLLRGSSSALESNRAVVAALRQGLTAAGLDPATVTLVEGGHDVTAELMRARGLVDVLVPRGGASLIQAVVTGA